MKKTNNAAIYIVATIAAFALFIGCIIGMQIAFPVKASNYTESEIKYLRENKYVHDSTFDGIGHNLNNAWLNLQDLIKGGE